MVLRTLLLTALVVLAVLLAAFAVGLRTGRHRGVDVAWGLAFAAVGLTACALSGGRGLLSTVLVVLWGGRLSAHLWWRARGAGEDPRYAAMLAGGGLLTVLTKVYLLQAVLVWCVSLPVQAASWLPAPPLGLAVAGTALWALGLVFEAVGDAQLARFQADPAHRGQLLTTGLRAWTRYPNYFGDACVWWGLTLLVLGTPAGWAYLPAPLLMTWLLAFGSGRPLLERRLRATRPEWAAYAARTSPFIPWPPRRRGS
ncbi:membrane protein [Kitasatospora sp. MMS16-BH015]|uniref:DUF1295 domain-containing protein n=1 Tax=Kitasatospora sp. MMS16-BH015 TaxID=2018025 RepID=UPI000CA3B1AE|nr:DUF1295 domain-containing protein [Kitasatospora sp. MMS16-BH015]AUG80636.1 membrane protein [Kitasatospora sp. MMS16-BH015]